MKIDRLIRFLLCSCSGMLFLVHLVGCSDEDKILTQLYGKWQLHEVVWQGTTTVVDTVYYNFEHDLFQYQLYRPLSDRFAVRYGFQSHTENGLLRLELTNSAGSINSFLSLTDWENSIETFEIEKLSSQRLILVRAEGALQGKRYLFRRF